MSAAAVPSGGGVRLAVCLDGAEMGVGGRFAVVDLTREQAVTLIRDLHRAEARAAMAVRAKWGTWP